MPARVRALSAALSFADRPSPSLRRERAVLSLPILYARAVVSRPSSADPPRLSLSLSFFLSLSAGVGCSCQPHGRERLADVLLQLVPAVAAAGRFPGRAVGM